VSFMFFGALGSPTLMSDSMLTIISGLIRRGEPSTITGLMPPNLF